MVRSIAPFQPFPTDALPTPLASYVRDGAAAIGCDQAYVALPVLAAVASTIGHSRVIQLKRGWTEPCLIWALIVGDSGTQKSPGWELGVSHLQRTQRRLIQEHGARLQEYVQACNEYESRRARCKRDGGDPGLPPEPPVLQRVICQDTTIEKLAQILDGNPRGLLVARDEMSAWLASFTRYKGRAGGSDLPHWLELHRLGTLIVDRKSTEGPKTIFVRPAGVSIAGSIQPKVLMNAVAVTPDYADSGLLARLLLAMPPKRQKRWSDVEMDPDIEATYHTLLDRLLALEMQTWEGEQTPYRLQLSTEARAAWIEFYNRWGAAQAAVDGDLAAAFSKLEGYTARFALLHHVVSHVSRGWEDRVAVEQPSIEAGVVLSQWFANEADRIYSTLSETPEEHDARRLVEFIQSRGGSITPRELVRSNKRRFPDVATAEAAIETLVQAELGGWDLTIPGDQGGRPSQRFHLHAPDETSKTPSFREVLSDCSDTEWPKREPGEDG